MSVVALATVKPDAAVIKQCEGLLAMAKSGRLRELAYVADLGAEGCLTNASRTTDATRQLGQVYRLAHRLQNVMDNNARTEK